MNEDGQTSSTESSVPSLSRRETIKAVTGTVAAGSIPLVGSTSAESEDSATVVLAPQEARTDSTDSDDFPVPDAFKINVLYAGFDDVSGTIAVPVKNSDGSPGVSEDDTFWHEGFSKGGNRVPANTPAFVVGLHSPEVGNGQPNSLSSLVGVRPLQAGTHLEVNVPVWAGPPPWQRKLGATPEQFPAEGETLEITATIWRGPDVFPPIVPRGSPAAIAQTPTDEQNGPLKTDGSLVSSSAEVEFGESDSGGVVPF